MSGMADENCFLFLVNFTNELVLFGINVGSAYFNL